jgi:hypothetical protein
LEPENPATSFARLNDSVARFEETNYGEKISRNRFSCSRRRIHDVGAEYQLKFRISLDADAHCGAKTLTHTKDCEEIG